MSGRIRITPRTLMIAMLMEVKYVKPFEEIHGVQELLKKKFGNKVDFWYTDEKNFLTMIVHNAPFGTTKENAGNSGYSVIVRPEYLREINKDMNFWMSIEAVDEKERKFLLKEVVQTIREYYRSLPGGRERLIKG